MTCNREGSSPDDAKGLTVNTPISKRFFFFFFYQKAFTFTILVLKFEQVQFTIRCGFKKCWMSGKQCGFGSTLFVQACLSAGIRK